MLDITRFFFGQTVSNNEEENQNTAPILETIDAACRLSRQSALIIDFFSHIIVYKSKRLLFIDETVSTDRKRESINPYWSLMSDDIMEKYMCVMDNYLLAEKGLSYGEFSSHVSIFDYPITVRGHELYITQRFTPITMGCGGSVKLGLFTVSHSNKGEMNCSIITQSDKRYRFDFSEGRFVSIGLNATLSTSEKAILHRAKMGMTNEEIAKDLYISVNKVKTHRVRIFKKLQVETITEALIVADNCHLL